MHITEMLVAGYDGDKSMFAVSLVDGHASVILTHTDEGGETVRSAWEQAVDSFDAVRDLVESIVDVPARAPSDGNIGD